MSSEITNKNSTLITSRRNALVKRLRSISKKQGREEYELILLEGTHLLEEALKTETFPVEIIATSKWVEKNQRMLNSIDGEVKLFAVTETVLDAAITTSNPDGVAALFPIAGLPSPPENPEFILAVDRLQDPGNLGSLFRTALAAEVEVLWLSSGVDPLNQKVIRSSVGAMFSLPYERFGPDECEGTKTLKKKLVSAAKVGFQIVASSVPEEGDCKKLVPYWEIDWTKPTILVLGNEGSGISKEIKNCCNYAVTLPHSDAVQSLNVAAAAVPLLLERRRAKMNESTFSEK